MQRRADAFVRQRCQPCAALASAGLIIGPDDLWIAVHALAENLVLVTNNERGFKRVKGLKVKNWAR